MSFLVGKSEHIHNDFFKAIVRLPPGIIVLVHTHGVWVSLKLRLWEAAQVTSHKIVCCSIIVKTWR